MIIRTTKITTPSKNASYSCVGCLKTFPATLPKFTAHGKSHGAPHNSPLIKFAILPKNNPIGTPINARSNKRKYGIFINFAPIIPPSKPPIKPPWKLMPPSLIAIIFAGFSK